MIVLKRKAKFEEGLKQIDIAPLIDIVFQLLIFFMLTSQFVVQLGFPVNLPKAATSELLRKIQITLVLTKEGVIYYKGKPISLKDLEVLLNKNKEYSVFVKADKYAKFEDVVKIWDLCRKIGVKRIHIATQKK